MMQRLQLFSRQMSRMSSAVSLGGRVSAPLMMIHRPKSTNVMQGQTAPLLAKHLTSDAPHFKANSIPHPLGDHTGYQQNHIFTLEEIAEVKREVWKHKPQSMGDRAANLVMYGLYHSFNFMTGYRPDNPTTKAIEWRLIVLESVAGVPGFVAAAFRHFKSLRSLQRDHGWILTLLEEAENERMHLLTCLTMFEASFATRCLVLAGQVVLTPTFILVYAVHPKTLHRFVGYLEETAVHTYINIVKHVEMPGSNLHKSWAHLPAPAIAVGYWRLPPDAKWVDALNCMMADEAHHRDVNHTFASMEHDDPNPFVLKHKQDAMKAWRLENNGLHAWESKDKAL